MSERVSNDFALFPSTSIVPFTNPLDIRGYLMPTGLRAPHGANCQLRRRCFLASFDAERTIFALGPEIDADENPEQAKSLLHEAVRQNWAHLTTSAFGVATIGYKGVNATLEWTITLEITQLNDFQPSFIDYDNLTSLRRNLGMEVKIIYTHR